MTPLDRFRSPLPVLAAGAIAVLASQAPLFAQSTQPASQAGQEQRLSEVEKENARLRQRLDEIASELEKLRGTPDASGADRLRALEAENQELRRRIDLVAGEVERSQIGELFTKPTTGEYGLGPAASKVYHQKEGVSIGGYGEFLYENFQGGNEDEIDALRAVLYFGYRFDEQWLFNSEIEFEHGGEEVGVEFAYLDYLGSKALNWRAGLVLVPMGFLNELHEPTTFLSTHRPESERRILPSTWRELGVGAFGDLGPFSYRTYVTSSFNAAGFSAAGLRDGRQEGIEASAEDFAWSGRLDYTAQPGLLVGVSAYYGDAAQGLEGVDATTKIADLHAEYRWRGLRARALATVAEVDDVAELDAALGLTGTETIGERLEGWYAEVGYDIVDLFASESRQSLTPFVRFESIDTQAKVPSGFASDPVNDQEIVTFGLSYQPIPAVVIKLDYQDFDEGRDVQSLSLGYIF